MTQFIITQRMLDGELPWGLNGPYSTSEEKPIHPNIEHLRLGTTSWEQGYIEREAIQYVSEKFPKLKFLHLSNLRWLNTIAGGIFDRSPLDFPNLTFLHVSSCPRLNNFRIRAPLLKRLEIFDNEALASIQVRVQFSAQIVFRTPHPKFDIERIPLEDSDLELIKDAPAESVEFLDLSYCDKITDSGLKHLTKLCPNKLSLRGCPKLTRDGMANLFSYFTGVFVELIRSVDIGELPQLSVFDLTASLSRACHIDLSDYSEQLDALFYFNAPGPWGLYKGEIYSGVVESLSVSNCSRLTDRFFHSLYNLKLLRELRANHLPLLTDLGLKGLIRNYLVKLSIAKCKQVTDAGLKALEESKTLKVLNVKGCPLVTLRGVLSLHKAIPGIQILHDLDSTVL